MTDASAFDWVGVDKRTNVAVVVSARHWFPARVAAVTELRIKRRKEVSSEHVELAAVYVGEELEKAKARVRATVAAARERAGAREVGPKATPSSKGSMAGAGKGISS